MNVESQSSETVQLLANEVKVQQSFSENRLVCPFVYFLLSTRVWQLIRYPQNIPRISPKYPKNIQRLYPEDIPQLSPRHQQDFPKISPKYPKDMFKISPRYPQNIPQVSQRYPLDFPKISPKYPPDMLAHCISIKYRSASIKQFSFVRWQWWIRMACPRTSGIFC